MKMLEVNVKEARSKLSNLLDRVERGEEIIIKRHGKKVALLVSPEIKQTEEYRTAPIEERIAAARLAAQRGFKVGFHFDPLIYYPGWEQGYERVVELLQKEVPATSIAWIKRRSFLVPDRSSAGRSRNVTQRKASTW